MTGGALQITYILYYWPIVDEVRTARAVNRQDFTTTLIDRFGAVSESSRRRGCTLGVSTYCGRLIFSSEKLRDLRRNSTKVSDIFLVQDYI